MTQAQKLAVERLEEAFSALKGAGLIAIFQNREAHVVNYRDLKAARSGNPESPGCIERCVVLPYGAFATREDEI